MVLFPFLVRLIQKNFIGITLEINEKLLGNFSHFINNIISKKPRITRFYSERQSSYHFKIILLNRIAVSVIISPTNLSFIKSFRFKN